MLRKSNSDLNRVLQNQQGFQSSDEITYLVPLSGGFFSVARNISVLYSILCVIGGSGMDRELK